MTFTSGRLVVLYKIPERILFFDGVLTILSILKYFHCFETKIAAESENAFSCWDDVLNEVET